MALIKCQECGKEISDKAVACIHCGCPISRFGEECTGATPKKMSSVKKVLISALILMCIFAVAFSVSMIITQEGGNSEKEEITNGEKLSRIITEVYLDEIYDNLVDVQGPIIDALMSYGKFETEEDIEAFELPWKIAIDTFDKDLVTLSTNIPADEYKEVWENLCVNLQKLRELCIPFTNLDPNGDGTYTSEEGDVIYNEKVPMFKDTLVSTLEDCKEFLILQEIYAVPEPEATKPEESKQAEEQSVRCVECDKDATHSYENPISGQKEPYCYTHYKGIIGTMGEMEMDVGKSDQSKHTCEECDREGTHVYYSFTGQTEYYCTEHYEELKDMIEFLGIE